MGLTTFPPGGGGGGDRGLATFTAPAASNNTALQAATDLVGAGATLTLTLTGSYARGVRLTVVSGTITGNVSITGPNPAGGSHTENVTQASGDTVKVFGPGTITVVIPTSTCRYSIGTTDWIGLPSTGPAKDVTGTGVGMQLALLWGGIPYAPELPDTGRVRAPSLAGGYGAWLPSAYGLIAWDGSTTAVLSYLATA